MPADKIGRVGNSPTPFIKGRTNITCKCGEKIELPKEFDKLSLEEVSEIIDSENTSDDIFQIACFMNRERLFTDKLHQDEAANFLAVARHLVAYLMKEYHLQ